MRRRIQRGAGSARRFAFQRHRRFRADGRHRPAAMAASAAQRGGGGLSLCLASVGGVKTLSVAAFTLVWTHSVEKIDWKEDGRIPPKGLELVQAAGKGSGAGNGPPAE